MGTNKRCNGELRRYPMANLNIRYTHLRKRRVLTSVSYVEFSGQHSAVCVLGFAKPRVLYYNRASGYCGCGVEVEVKHFPFD